VKFFEKAEVLLQIQPPSEVDLKGIKSSQVWISAFNPLFDQGSCKNLPRTEKLQPLVSTLFPVQPGRRQWISFHRWPQWLATRQCLEAALRLPTFFPMFMTAAGTIKPANVLILGAGVAGLQAVATARRLGGQVYVFDVRSAVKEEVKSLGGKVC
jgi:H+-translocating NAD(P) transhydrogenase subunit alpha